MMVHHSPLLMQIRDAEHMIAAPRLEALLQMILPHKAPVTWLAMAYKGVAIRRTEIPDGGSVLKVAIASMDDWLVITFGDGVIRKMVDTHNGDSPSLRHTPLLFVLPAVYRKALWDKSSSMDRVSWR